MNTKQLIMATTLVASLQSLGAREIWEGDNRFSLNAAVGFNIKLSSRNLEAAPPNPGPETGAQVDRFYDNGFVRVDASDNAGNQTTYWGFDKSRGATADGLPGGAVTLSSTRSPAQGQTLSAEDEPQPGLELGYARRLLRFGDEKKPWLIVGFEANCSFLDLNITDTTGITGNAVTLDTYHLAPGNIVLGNTYQGTFLGDPPGPLLDSEPSRAYTTGTATLSHRLQGQMYGFNMGPTFELPLGRFLLVNLSGGLAVMGVDADDTMRESVTIGTAPTVTTTSGSRFDAWNCGPYVKAAVAVRLGRQWSAQCGFQWQDTGALTRNAGNYQTRLDFSDTLLLTCGISFSF